ncbi:hypothetical protein GCM10010411_53460 [Actinomadura fulvescens]|uniref:Uncharacterized protein n=1 Tax=Actinomadura fulvescens TaxID=46160 RepID=A0ABN3Q3G2_9ACTN
MPPSRASSISTTNRVLVLSAGQFTGLSTLIDIDDQTVRTRTAEDLVFHKA